MSTAYTAYTAYTQPEPQSRGMSVPHLVVGLVFLGIAGAWGLHEIGVIESVQVQWLLPLILVVAGAAGLLASVARSIARRPRNHPAEDTTGDTLTDKSEETFVTDETP